MFQALALHGGSIPPISILKPSISFEGFKMEMSEATACLARGNRKPQWCVSFATGKGERREAGSRKNSGRKFIR